MEAFTIKSKIMNKEITFTRPGNSYIYMDSNGESGTLGQQPTDNGATLMYCGDDQAAFERTCRLWYRRHIRSLREVYEYAG